MSKVGGKAADLNAGAKQEKDQAKEEEDEDRPTVSPPVWRFVCRISDAEQAKLLSDACAQPKSRAERPATAAGMKLGPLASLDSRDLAPGEGGSSGQSAGISAARILALVPGITESAPDGPNEAVGSEPHKIRWGIRVTAAHRFVFPMK